jgi:hypothetical protein
VGIGTTNPERGQGSNSNVNHPASRQDGVRFESSPEGSGELFPGKRLPGQSGGIVMQGDQIGIRLDEVPGTQCRRLILSRRKGGKPHAVGPGQLRTGAGTFTSASPPLTTRENKQNDKPHTASHRFTMSSRQLDCTGSLWWQRRCASRSYTEALLVAALGRDIVTELGLRVHRRPRSGAIHASL